MRWVYPTLLLVIGAVIVAFIAQNHEHETVTFFNQTINAPMSIFFVAVYFLGMWSEGTVGGFVKRAYQYATERAEQKQTSQSRCRLEARPSGKPGRISRYNRRPWCQSPDPGAQAGTKTD
jgi:hypothetical protein